MRFGVCAILDENSITAVKSAGYDYVEAPLNSLYSMSDAELEAVKAFLDKNCIAAESYNCFFGANMPLTGENVDFDAISDYADIVLKKAAYLGGKTAVIGSGGARKIPEGFSRALAEEQFIKVIDICGDIAVKYGMKIAVEPLNASETNLINTVSECRAIVERCGNPSVGVLADFFHVFMSGEPLGDIADSTLSLLHVHLARADKDRCMPCLGRDDEAMQSFSEVLKNNGYDSRISLEGVYGDDFAETVIKAKCVLDKYFI